MLMGCNHQALLCTMYVYIYIYTYGCFWKCGVPQNCYSIGKWSQPNAFWNFEVTLFSAKPFFRIWSLSIQDEPKSPFGGHENSKPGEINCLTAFSWRLHFILRRRTIRTTAWLSQADEPGHPSIPSGWGAAGAPNDAWHQFLHSLRAHMDLAIDGSPRSSRSVENRLRADAWALRSLQYQDGKVLLWAWSS